MERKHVFTTMTILLLCAGIYYLSDITGVIKFFLGLLIYSVLFYLMYFGWKRLRNKPYRQYPEYLLGFLNKVSGALLLIVLILGGGGYYYNNISPAAMPTFTLSNGEKTVIFQAMSHIGSQDFYSQISQDITQAKENDYVYFFEGVRPGTPENHEKFDQAMGIEFNPDLYKNFSKLYGVEYQNQKDFIGLVNDLDFNIDLSIDEIIYYYEQQDLPETPDNIQMPLDANTHVVETLAGLNERQLKVLVFINQAILNIIIQSDSTQTFLTNNFANKDLFNIILDKRNEVLAEAIINSEHNNIYTTYGLLHFNGVYQILKENDENWQIIETKYLYPIQ